MIKLLLLLFLSPLVLFGQTLDYYNSELKKVNGTVILVNDFDTLKTNKGKANVYKLLNSKKLVAFSDNFKELEIIAYNFHTTCQSALVKYRFTGNQLNKQIKDIISKLSKNEEITFSVICKISDNENVTLPQLNIIVIKP